MRLSDEICQYRDYGKATVYEDECETVIEPVEKCESCRIIYPEDKKYSGLLEMDDVIDEVRK